MTNVKSSNQRAQKALLACSQWLAACLKFGWQKSDLDRLEAIWWEFHNERGELISAHDTMDLQQSQEQVRHLERRIRELTEQLNCLKLDSSAVETAAAHRGGNEATAEVRLPNAVELGSWNDTPPAAGTTEWLREWAREEARDG